MRFYAVVGGRPSVLVLAGGTDGVAVARLRDAVCEAVPAGVDVHGVATSAPPDGTWFHDPDGHVHGAYGVPTDADPHLVVLDRNVRVVTAERVVGDHDVHRVAGTAVGAGKDAATTHAPVLLVPGALSPELCDRLIELWRTVDPAATGVEAGAGDDRAELADTERKRRRDHTVEDPDLLRTLTDHVGRRVMPELERAFAYRASRFEGFKIGGYDESDRGFFAPHRDNLSPSTAHRRFALTLNLNDDYVGGELRFPEYGDARFRPAPGEALVFSGALLHEVRPVTRGRRYVLLSFLFGGGARRR